MNPWTLPKRYTICSGGCKPIHPDIESLISFCDGRLPADRHHWIETHLRGCEECQIEYNRLVYAAEGDTAADPAESSSTDNDQLAGLFANIRAWKTAHGGPENTIQAVKSRVGKAMEAYLGVKGTSTLLLRVSDDGGDLLSIVEPVLGLFLSRKAASLLVSHIVDRAIVRI